MKLVKRIVIGLVIAGLATSMPVLVAGRLVQGLGTGGQTVALYVVVARVYPASMHGRVFAAFSAAWVVPSLIGPFLAGAVAEFLHWRWVFLGVAALTVIAFAMVVLRLHGLPLHTDDPASGRVGPRMACAVAVAVTVPPLRVRVVVSVERSSRAYDSDPNTSLRPPT